jgi:hypothetical protein
LGVVRRTATDTNLTLQALDILEVRTAQVVQELGILIDGPGEGENGMGGYQNGVNDYGDYGDGMNGANYAY